MHRVFEISILHLSIHYTIFGAVVMNKCSLWESILTFCDIITPLFVAYTSTGILNVYAASSVANQI